VRALCAGQSQNPQLPFFGGNRSAARGGTTYKYDPVGNLTNVVYSASPAIALKYDVLNRLTNMVDAVGTTVYGYDSAGQLLSEDGPMGRKCDNDANTTTTTRR